MILLYYPFTCNTLNIWIPTSPKVSTSQFFKLFSSKKYLSVISSQKRNIAQVQHIPREVLLIWQLKKRKKKMNFPKALLLFLHKIDSVTFKQTESKMLILPIA